MQVIIEQLTNDFDEKYRFVHIKNNKRVKHHLEVIDGSFINNSVISDSLINDFTGDEREYPEYLKLALLGRLKYHGK